MRVHCILKINFKKAMKEVAIVGGGILGLAIGYQLNKCNKNYKITLFEKENIK